MFLKSEDSSAESEVFPSANRPDLILVEMRLFTDGQLRGASGRVLGQATQPLALWPQVTGSQAWAGASATDTLKVLVGLYMLSRKKTR